MRHFDVTLTRKVGLIEIFEEYLEKLLEMW